MISLVVPCYNEENRIELSVQKIKSFLKTSKFNWEVIFINDGSSDKTLELAKHYKNSINVPSKIISFNNNRGKGAAVKAGMLEALGDLILMSDLDLSTPLSDLDKLLPFINEKTVVIGSRAVKDSHIIKKQPFPRVVLGKTGNFLIKLFAVNGINDTQCGFKLFTKKSSKEIFSKVTIAGFAFDIESLFLAKKLGYNIKEVPVSWENAEGSKVTLKGIIKTFFDLFTIRWRHR